MTPAKWVVLPKVSDNLEEQLLANRQIKDKDSFFNPAISPQPLVDLTQLQIALERIKKAIDPPAGGKELIYIYGDFDVDGVTATALLWETLNDLGAKVMPYIPHREKEGYGLAEKGLRQIAEKGGRLVITVDCGVGAIEQAKLAKELGLELIITDHHQKSGELPEAVAILHTYELSGVGVAYELASALYESFGQPTPVELLDLVCIGTIADMVPLLGKNRSFAKLGLAEMNQTKRAGLRAIVEEAAIKLGNLGTFEVSFIIAPRLNAMGRLEHAYDSLRILLTKDPDKARLLARKLSLTNSERQRLTREAIEQAQEILELEGKNKKMFVLHNEGWQQGIIGLVAGKLTDQYCRPVLVISKGEVHSKGSARSVNGINIVEAIQSCSDILVNCGGHPAAAGFTIETERIPEFKERVTKWAEDKLNYDSFIPEIKIEAQLRAEELNLETHTLVAQFAPFGIGNPQPLFLTCGLTVHQVRTVGSEGKHLKLILGIPARNVWSLTNSIEAIGFGMGKKLMEVRIGSRIDIAYVLDVDRWNGKEKLVLKLKDFRPSENKMS